MELASERIWSGRDQKCTIVPERRGAEGAEGLDHRTATAHECVHVVICFEGALIPFVFVVRRLTKGGRTKPPHR